MAVEKNKEIVQRFFKDALDDGNVDLLDEMFNENCAFFEVIWMNRQGALKA